MPSNPLIIQEKQITSLYNSGYKTIFLSTKSLCSGRYELWIVIRKDQGAKSLVNDNSDIFEFEIINKIKGFWVIKSKIK